MLVVCAMHDDQRLAKRRRIAGIKSGIPLLVFLAKADNHNISIFNAFAGANGIEPRAFIVMPELVRLCAHDGHAAIIAGVMVCHRSGKCDLHIAGRMGDLVTPVGMDFTGKIYFQHGRLSFLWSACLNRIWGRATRTATSPRTRAIMVPHRASDRSATLAFWLARDATCITCCIGRFQNPGIACQQARSRHGIHAACPLVIKNDKFENKTVNNAAG